MKVFVAVTDIVKTAPGLDDQATGRHDPLTFVHVITLDLLPRDS